MNVLLLCSQGMSTGMLCEKITQAAKEDGKELHIQTKWKSGFNSAWAADPLSSETYQ